MKKPRIGATLAKTLMCLDSEHYTPAKEIEKVTNSTAVHSDIHDLRRAGIGVAPAKYLGLSPSGRKIYGYKLGKTRGGYAGK
jgi:hypothetical protein